MGQPNRFYKYSILIFFIILNYVLIHILDQVYYFFIDDGNGTIFGNISEGLAYFILPINDALKALFINPLSFIFYFPRLLLIPFGILIVNSRKILYLATIVLSLITLYLIGAPIITTINSQLKLGDYDLFSFFTFPLISLYPLALTSLFGFKSNKELSLKLLLTSLLLFLIITPLITISSNSSVLTFISSFKPLHKPTYLPASMGKVASGGDTILPPDIKWLYYCQSYITPETKYKTYKGDLIITQSKIGEKDSFGDTISLENELNDFDKSELVPVVIHGNQGYFDAISLEDSSTSFELIWQENTKLVKIKSNCNFLNKEELLIIAESMK